MKMLRSVGTAAALSVAGAGIAIGGVGLATADDTSGDTSTSEMGPAFAGERGPGGHRGGPGGPGVIASELAEALDLDEDDVAAALRTVFMDLRPDVGAEGEMPTPPTEAEREARRAEFVSALAKELGVSEAKVTAALDALHAEHEATMRTALEERLDAAVDEGTLTEADKASVLKAFDAGVLRPDGPHGG